MARARHLGWLVAVGMTLACEGGRAGGGTAAPPPFDPGPVPAEHAAGAQLFLASCTGCHGRAGSGFTGGPPLLDTLYLPPRFSDSAVRRAVLAGAPSHNWDFDDMPAIRTVRPDQIPAVVGYLRWVQARWLAGRDSIPGGVPGDSEPAPPAAAPEPAEARPSPATPPG
jgi:mono/diheme cytochrome c family protein